MGFKLSITITYKSGSISTVIVIFEMFLSTEQIALEKANKADFSSNF